MLTYEKLEILAEELEEYIVNIIGSGEVEEDWINSCEIATASAIELMNASVKMSNAGMVPCFSLDIISRMLELKFVMHNRLEVPTPEIEYLSEAIPFVGRGILQQSEKHRKMACDFFKITFDEIVPVAAMESSWDYEHVGTQPNDSDFKCDSLDVQALKILYQVSKTSDIINISLVQRNGAVGYGKALMILELLEKKNYIQTLDEARKENSQFRRILLTREEMQEKLKHN